MVETYGLTHLAVSVRDPERSFRFYEAVFGAVAVYRTPDLIQFQTPGTHEAIVLERDGERAGIRGGIAHFGFRLKRAADIDVAVETVKAAGGTITDRGEFTPGEPYLFCRDPDGYEVEIWFEPGSAVT